MKPTIALRDCFRIPGQSRVYRVYCIDQRIGIAYLRERSGDKKTVSTIPHLLRNWIRIKNEEKEST